MRQEPSVMEIRQALCKESSCIHAEDTLKKKIDQRIKLSIRKKESSTMKKISLKKPLTIGLALCIVATISCFASGVVSQITGSNLPETTTTQYSEVDDLADKAGYAIKSIEKFSNGYVFKEAQLGEFEEQDDSGNALGKYIDYEIDYENTKGAVVTLYANTAKLDSDEPDQTIQYNNTTVGYYLDHYKFVPEDYTCTPEDEKKMADGSLFVTYGADEIKEQDCATVTWIQDGVHYSLSAFDTKLTAQQMFDMAGELIVK